MLNVEAVTMSEYIIGGLIFAGIFVVPAVIVSIIDKVKAR